MISYTTPQLVVASGVVFDNTCSTTGEDLECTGYNSTGKIGNGSTTNQLSPVQVTGLISGITLTEAASPLTSGVQSLAGRKNTFCALMTTGALECWGYNDFGAVGDGNTTHTGTPQTTFASGAQALSVGPRKGLHRWDRTPGNVRR